MLIFVLVNIDELPAQLLNAAYGGNNDDIAALLDEGVDVEYADAVRPLLLLICFDFHAPIFVASACARSRRCGNL